MKYKINDPLLSIPGLMLARSLTIDINYFKLTDYILGVFFSVCVLYLL